MDNLCEKLIKLLEKPEDYLRPSDKLQTWIDQTRNIYNFAKGEEGKYNLPASADSLQHLNTDGLDTEQIWQLLELQNKSLLAAPDDLKGLDDVNLCFSVAKLSSLAKYDKLLINEEEEGGKDLLGDSDSVLSKSSDGDQMEEGSDDDDDDEDEGMGSLETLEEEEEEEEDLSDEEMFKNSSEIDGGLNLVFDDDSDNEEDNFDDLIAPEGMEDSDDDEDESGDKARGARKAKIEASEDEEEKEVESEKVKDESQKSKTFGKTPVDSQFFRLRECEWVADNDIIGDNYDMDLEDIDLMKDISDGEGDEEGVMYDAFFGSEQQERKSKKLADPGKDEGSDGYEDEDDEELEGGVEGEATLMKDELHDSDAEGGSSEVTQLLGLKKKEEKSTFEKERERELMLMSTLEEDNISEKPWFLKGEAISTDRPENSTLEEQLDYNIVARQRPVITEDTTTLIEKIILNRVRTKAWSDVQRKVRPNIDPFEYKKKLLLDQEKSKKSLAEIYEQEYLKQQQQQQQGDDGKQEEELPEHKEIREKMDGLFSLLDALANYHYTPRQASAEVKIQSNLPAVTMEEATPVTASDATLLAPQEILAPVRGELRGKSELTKTDKKRDRRSKKAHQKKKSKMQEQKLQEKLKKAAGGGKKLDATTSLKFIEKAVKAGQVTLLEGQQNKVVKSSVSFFKNLQETKANSKQKKLGRNKERKEKVLPDH